MGYRISKLPTFPDELKDELRKAASKPDMLFVIAGERTF
jgi:hypothetical protein